MCRALGKSNRKGIAPLQVLNIFRTDEVAGELIESLHWPPLPLPSLRVFQCPVQHQGQIADASLPGLPEKADVHCSRRHARAESSSRLS